MKQDVLKWSRGEKPGKVISKETLNHPGIIEHVTGLNVFSDTKDAFLEAYRALGIDIINRVPSQNAPAPCKPGRQIPHPDNPDYTRAALGVYDTVFRHSFPFSSLEDFWAADQQGPVYDELIVPVPHPCDPEDIRLRENILGDTGLYYPMLYTTLFMWAVEYLGWDIFLTAAALEPDRIYEKFLVPGAARSKNIVEIISTVSESPFVFLHDDLASATGPMFNPKWYDDYIFPLYPEIFAPAKARGKKIIFVADGNMEAFLGRLVEAGVDGIMYENPATRVEAAVEHFGAKGRFFIGGIETAKLTFGRGDEIEKMVHELCDKYAHLPGFAISSCGGLHGNIPLENLIAYFNARVDIGASPAKI